MKIISQATASIKTLISKKISERRKREVIEVSDKRFGI